MEKYIVVIGSKPNALLPNIKAAWVFSANGAAEKGDFFCKKLKIFNHSSIVGTKEFEKNPEVSKRVMKSDLCEIIFRYGSLSSPNFKFNNKIKIIEFSKFNQFIFQKNFFKNSIFDLLYSETLYKKYFFNKLIYFFHCLTQKGFLCSSTGLFSILYALERFPNHKIIISGIGPTKNIDSHYYDNSTNYVSRSRVDDRLFKKIKFNYKKRIISTDFELSKKYGFLLWNKETVL